VREGDVVTLGPIRLTAHATPDYSPRCTTWTMDVKEGAEPHKVIFFCSAMVALNQLVKNPTYPTLSRIIAARSNAQRFWTATSFSPRIPKCTIWGEARADRRRQAEPVRQARRIPGLCRNFEDAFETALAKQAEVAGTPAAPAAR
jgi:hypothetical protein